MNYHENKKWYNDLIISGVLHLVLCLVLLFGNSYFFSKKSLEDDIMVFEVLPIGAIVNVKTESKIEQKEQKAENAKQVKKTYTKATNTEQKPVENVKKDEKKTEDKPSVKNVKPKPQKDQKTAPKQNPQKKKKDDSDIDELLKNLDEESKGKDSKKANSAQEAQKASDKSVRGTNYDENMPISTTELQLIKSQIYKHWRVPVGAKDLEKTELLVYIAFEKDGTVKDAIIKNTVCPIGASVTCRLLEDTALRAVKMASPIENLPPIRYDVWKEVQVIFDPKDII